MNFIRLHSRIKLNIEKAIEKDGTEKKKDSYEFPFSTMGN